MDGVNALSLQIKKQFAVIYCFYCNCLVKGACGLLFTRSSESILITDHWLEHTHARTSLSESTMVQSLLNQPRLYLLMVWATSSSTCTPQAVNGQAYAVQTYGWKYSMVNVVHVANASLKCKLTHILIQNLNDIIKAVLENGFQLWWRVPFNTNRVSVHSVLEDEHWQQAFSFIFKFTSTVFSGL